MNVLRSRLTKSEFDSLMNPVDTIKKNEMKPCLVDFLTDNYLTTLWLSELSEDAMTKCELVLVDGYAKKEVCRTFEGAPCRTQVGRFCKRILAYAQQLDSIYPNGWA